jgi:hypothetical protein
MDLTRTDGLATPEVASSEHHSVLGMLAFLTKLNTLWADSTKQDLLAFSSSKDLKMEATIQIYSLSVRKFMKAGTIKIIQKARSSGIDTTDFLDLEMDLVLSEKSP